MATYTLEKSFDTRVELSENVREVANMFGLGGRRDRVVKVLDNCRIRIEAGQVVYITGGSGAGKSLLLKLLKDKLGELPARQEETAKPIRTGEAVEPVARTVIDPDEEPLPKNKPLVDCFGGADLSRVLGWLSGAGLSDAFAILRSPEQLSDGQRYRFRLAMATAQKPEVICIDEFCAALDRVTAAVVAHNVRKFADRFGITFIVATSHDDMLEDLCPDVVVVKHLGSGCDVYYPGRINDDD